MILSEPSQFIPNYFLQHSITSASNSVSPQFSPLPLRPSFTPKSRVFCSSPLEWKSENPKNNHFTIPSSENEEEKQVHCEVDVISWRERRVRACVAISADVQSVWNVLTDYEKLADFVPNLVCSERIDCPHPGRIWVAQQGMQRALYWHIEARVVLDLQEFPDSANGRELHFSMVDGDFKKFEGKWSLKTGQSSSTSILSYEVNVIPRFNFPAIFLERIIRSDLPVNLQAIACRAEKKSGVNQKTLTDESVMAETSNLPSNEFKENYASSNLGPVPASTGKLISNWGVFGKVCRLDRLCMADEVHLRRFDGLLEDGGVHRCVAASITVKAPIHKVWNVLTAYESLPEIVPNLAISKILSRESNKVRILQEGCKGLLYMVLHARAILDLQEQFESEISFEQVEGDFDSFQGKWILEQLGNQHTLLKYIVESKMQKNSFLSEAIVEEVIYEDLPSNLCAIRDCVEKSEVVGSDSLETAGHAKHEETKITPVNCIANIENHKSTGQVSNFHEENISRQRPRVPGLQNDIGVLKSELLKFIQDYGQEGFMPMRKQLRLHGRVDLEKAITRMGGFRRIASLMNLSLAYKNRKPKGYWDSLENLQEEISRFQTSWGMDPTYMPSRKSFERAGRYDLARALEKWGGLHEVSRLLLLKVRHRNRQTVSTKEEKTQEPGNQEKGTYSSNNNINNDKPYVSQDTHEWLSKLKYLDINWVE